MDFDLEIIDEEGDCPNPLFDSIMNAMNSMKEATADKIYRKIQKEGELNYSKPQVDRALASALKYGIFEVRNNRYRVRDDILDDENTVYWKLQKKREQTPFRVQEDINEKHLGPKLDPERDNQRFRRIVNTESQECPHCGKSKKPALEMKKLKALKKATAGKKNIKSSKKGQKNERISKRKTELKRKRRSDLKSEHKLKRKKINDAKQNELQDSCEKEFYAEEKLSDELRSEKCMSRKKEAYNAMPSEMTLSTVSDHSFNNLTENCKKFSNQNKDFQSQQIFECRDANFNVAKVKRSSISIKSESDSEKTGTSDSDYQSQDRVMDSFFDDLPCTSENASNKIKNQYSNSGEIYNSQYKSNQTNQCKEQPDWFRCSNEPQGAIIQSNNVLTIEPMDSLALKNPEQASYIS